MKIKLLLVAVAFCFILSSSIVLAQDWWAEWWTGMRYSGGIENMLTMVLGKNVPREWLSLPNFVYFIVFPFVAAWAVIYGVMEEIQIFRRAKTSHKIVSFVMAAMLLPTGYLMIAVNYLYMIDAVVALFAFGFLFLFGTILWAVGRGYGMTSEFDVRKRMMGDVKNEVARYTQEIERLQRELAQNPNDEHRYDKLTKITDYEGKRRDALRNLREL